MTATVPVTTATAPPPPPGGTDPAPARSQAAKSTQPATAPPAQASDQNLSTTDAAKVILAQPAAATQSASDLGNQAPTAQQIQSALSDLLIQLDNQPAEHPNAPAVVLLQNKETALRAALTQVQLVAPGAGQAYLSGVVLNAAV
jgi:hypothetical protein